MLTRSKRILTLVKKDEDFDTHLLFLPKYESTKGTTSEEQILAIEGKLNEISINIIINILYKQYLYTFRNFNYL